MLQPSGVSLSRGETTIAARAAGLNEVSGFKATSCTLFKAFLQQSFEVGISICPQRLLIMRQQVRSSMVILASGAMHAIAGATQDTSNSRIAPNWRKGFTL